MIYYKIFVLLLLLFVSKIVFADIHDAPISKAVIESDKRLGSKVDIAYEKIYIGELLEEIKSSSGIDISASDKDKMAGIPIMIYMKDKTVASVMNALWSFISYNGAVCDWKVNGTGDNAKYIFIRPKTSIDLPGKLSDDIQSEFENHAKALLELAKSPEGKKNADTFESDFINRSSQRTRDGIATLAESLQEKDIDSLMKGKKTVTISIDQLSSKGRGFVEYAFKQASPKIVDPDTGAILQEVPFPKTIKIQVDNSSVPCLFIEIGDMGGHGYIGGRMFMDKQLEKISRDWMLPCDKKQNEILEKTLLSSKGSSNVPDKIKVIFDLKNISIISSPMDENDNKSLPDLNGGSLGDFLRDSKKSSKGIIYKWNNDVLLFSYFTF